jgi:hypothetical protein
VKNGLGKIDNDKAYAAVNSDAKIISQPQELFRYYIPHFIWSDAAWILAVAHGSRRPEYWIERKNDLG